MVSRYDALDAKTPVHNTCPAAPSLLVAAERRDLRPNLEEESWSLI